MCERWAPGWPLEYLSRQGQRIGKSSAKFVALEAGWGEGAPPPPQSEPNIKSHQTQKAPQNSLPSKTTHPIAWWKANGPRGMDKDQESDQRTKG